jgi:anthranilate synthase/aminodeoxychorismate synthase-like glutamine amidotransferase
MYVYNALPANIVDNMASITTQRRILVLDNDDSFTYNLAQLVGLCGGNAHVHARAHVERALKHGQLDVVRDCDGVLLGPGHGRPEVSAHTLRLLLDWRPNLPVLGVCLGHQAIGTFLGAKVATANTAAHGVRALVSHNGQHIFRGISTPLWVTRYNSLAISREHLPDSLEITAQLVDGEIMGIRDKFRSIQGIQFHPESILSEYGHQLFSNWLEAL